MTNNIIPFEKAVARRLQAEAEQDDHFNTLLALTELLAPTIRAMRETGAPESKIAAVLRFAADEVEGRP